MGDVQPRGSLQLLSENGDIELARFQIKKETTTLGRALTNDVRLLLEDVSRKHCTIEFDKDSRAVLHVMGSGGVWHNDVHVKPHANDTHVKLEHGDKLKISKHTLTFSYVTAAPASPRKRKPSSAVPESTATPRRQSARIKARASMPCFQTAWTPERAMRPIPLTQQTAPPEPVQDSPTIVSIDQLNTPQKFSMIQADLNVWERTSSETNVHETHQVVDPVSESDLQKDSTETKETAGIFEQEDLMNCNKPEPEPAESETTEPRVSEPGIINAKPVDPSPVESQSVEPKPADPNSMEPVSFESNHVELERLDPHSESIESHPVELEPNELDAVGAESMHFDSAELGSIEPVTLASDQVEVKSELDQYFESQPNEPVEPNKSFEAVDDHVWHTETISRSTEGNSNASHDTSDLTLCLEELEEQEKIEANRLLSAASPMTPRFPSTPQLRWSPAKSRKVSLRTATLLKRSALLPIVPLADMVPQSAQTPPPSVDSRIPASTDSKDMELSAILSDEEDEEEVDSSLELQCASSPLPPRPLNPFMTPQTKREEKPKLRRMSCSEMDQPSLRRQQSWQWLKNLFSPSKKTVPEPTEVQESVPVESEHASKEVHEQEEQESFFDASGDMDMTSVHHATTPKSNEKNAAPTPDMHILKHVFAEPKQAVSAESTMHHFRHMMLEPEQTSAMDMSMSHAWTAMEEHARELPPDANVPAQTLQVLTPETDRLTKHRTTRTVPKKEPYAPVRRQLPPRNAVKMSRIGSLSTPATRTVSEQQQAARSARAAPPDTQERRPGMASSLPVARAGTATRSRTTKESISRDREDATLGKRVTRGTTKTRKN